MEHYYIVSTWKWIMQYKIANKSWKYDPCLVTILKKKSDHVSSWVLGGGLWGCTEALNRFQTKLTISCSWPPVWYQGWASECVCARVCVCVQLPPVRPFSPTLTIKNHFPVITADFQGQVSHYHVTLQSEHIRNDNVSRKILPLLCFFDVTWMILPDW